MMDRRKAGRQPGPGVCRMSDVVVCGMSEAGVCRLAEAGVCRLAEAGVCRLAEEKLLCVGWGQLSWTPGPVV